MPDTQTANYDLVKPEINGSPNTWGNKLNDNADVIDTQLKRVDDLATGAVSRAGSGTDPDDYIMDVLRYAESVEPSDDLDLPHIALLKAWITNASPIGGVIAWGGTVGSIPDCWNLCDGGTYNGVTLPNLRDRFVIGAGGDLSPGAFGGAKTHNHGGNTGATALTIAQIPSHNHGVNDPAHNHSVSDPGHTHYTSFPYTGLVGQAGGYGGLLNQPGSGTSNIYTSTSYTGVYLSASYTGISIQYTGSGNSHNHTIAVDNHMPPYYALAFIGRTKFPWDE